MLAGTFELDDDAQDTAQIIPFTRTTLLLTDLVGSSALLRECGDQVGGDIIHRLVSRHKVLARHLGGQPIKTLGDGLMARFDSPAAAVQAAELITTAHRRDLHGCSPHPIKVRVAVHHGMVGVLPDGDLIGREATLVFELISYTKPNRAILSESVAQACCQFVSVEGMDEYVLPKSGRTVRPWLLESVREDSQHQLDRIAGLWARMNPGQAIPQWTRPPVVT